MILILIPIAVLESRFLPRTDRVDWFSKKPDLPFPVIFHVVLAGVAWGGNVILWVVALRYTSTVHAALLTSVQPMILSVFYQCTGHSISALEWLGILVATVGIFIASLSGLMAEGASHASTNYASEVLGDILCLLSAFCEVFILLNRQKVKPYGPLMQVIEF